MKKIKLFIQKIKIEHVILILYHLFFLMNIPNSPWYLLMFLPHVIIVIVSLRIKSNNTFITKIVFTYNHIIFGNKGKGKDLLYQLAIVKKFKKIHKKNPNKVNYLSNVNYGYGYQTVDLKSLSMSYIMNNQVYHNTYREFIDNKINIVKKINEYEGLNVLLSDAGIIFPSNEDTYLVKAYPSFAVFFALSRQLYDMLIGLNTQALNRIWIKLREQQEAYIRCEQTIPLYKSGLSLIWKYIPFLRKYLFIKVTYYEKYESAERGLLPFTKLGMLDHAGEKLKTSISMAMKKQYHSEHGSIRSMILAIKIKDIVYDTRTYHEKIFGMTFTEWLKSRPKLDKSNRGWRSRLLTKLRKK